MDDTPVDEILALARLREIFDDDREAIVEILRECSTYLRGSLDELTISVSSVDRAGVLRAAHAIKGSCANVGALACERAAARLESDVRGGSVPEDVSPLRRCIDDLEVAIERYAEGSLPA